MDYYRPIRLFKNIWWFLLINFVWGTLASLYYNDAAFLSWRTFWQGAIFGFSISASYVYGFLLIWYAMDERYNWITQTGKRIFYGLLYGELYAVLSFAVLAMINGFLIFGGDLEQATQAVRYAWPFPAINFFPSVLIVCAVAFFKNWSNAVSSREKMRTQLMQYKFESLQNQLNPHFLFNSFNVLSNLVYDDKQLALRFVDQLSELYQYVLNTRDRHLVSLDEELKFVQAYYFLLKVRFEEKIDLNLDVKTHEKFLIAPMVTQLLVENAVKHNVVTKASPLHISIYLRSNTLIVANSLSPKKNTTPSTKMGLKNIIQRYALLTDIPVVVQSRDGMFEVSVPLLQSDRHEVS